MGFKQGKLLFVKRGQIKRHKKTAAHRGFIFSPKRDYFLASAAGATAGAAGAAAGASFFASSM